MRTASIRRVSRTSALIAGLLLAPGGAITAASPSGTPIITFVPLTETTLTLSDHDTAIVQYNVTNQSAQTHALAMQPIAGVTIGGGGSCVPFTLGPHASCVLDLQLQGSAMTGDINGGPIVCHAGNPNQCYSPPSAAQLHVTVVHDAVVSLDVTPSNLSMPVGDGATIGVANADASLAAGNVRIDVPAGSAISVVSTTCPSSLPAGTSCTFDIAGAAPEMATTVTVAGDNTMPASVVVTVFDDVIFADGFEQSPVG